MAPDPARAPAPPVFTLVPPDDRLSDWLVARSRYLEAHQGRATRERGRGGRSDTSAPPAPALLVFRRRADGRVTVDDFPDEVDVSEPLVGRLDPALVRLERGRLYVEAANGTAVYVPIGPSVRPSCRRYGRLYLRLHPPDG